MNDQLEPDEKTIEEDIDTANLVYLLYLASVLIWVAPSFAGFIMALVNKKGAPDWLRSHFSFQIQTYWKGFLMSFVSFLLLSVWIGFFTLIGTVVWWVFRCVGGMRLMKQKKPISDVGTWHYKIH